MERFNKYRFGHRGWILIIYQATAFMFQCVFATYPLNILSDMYGGAQRLATISAVGVMAAILIQLLLNKYIGKISNILYFSLFLGLLSLIGGMAIMLVSPAHSTIWCFCYGLERTVTLLYSTFAVGILVGQWFPTRKGTIMGIATLAFPIANGLVGFFAKRVFAKGEPDLFGAFLPFFIVCLIGWILGLLFLRDYPEQCGCYRDNNCNMTPEVAQKMMLEEIQNKKTSVWSIYNTIKCRDFWCVTIPIGFMLMFSVGIITQTSKIFAQYEESMAAIGGYKGFMVLFCIVGCIGSYTIGLIDTKWGTKKALLISSICMILAGIFASVPKASMLVTGMVFLGIYDGSASNFAVSIVAQYWRREDFGKVLSVLNPVANVIFAMGPMLVVRLINSSWGYQSVFAFSAVAGAVSIVLLMIFKPKHLMQIDNAYRLKVGKPIDNELEFRK